MNVLFPSRYPDGPPDEAGDQEERLNLRLSKGQSSWAGRVGAILVLLVMSAASVAVWWSEIRHDRQAIQHHAQDVCTQASRRLEVAVNGSLRAASIFARRWAADPGRDLSRQEFEEFVTVMVAEVPGFHSAWFVPADQRPAWQAPQSSVSAWDLGQRAEPDLIARSKEQPQVILSAPVTLEDGSSRFFAILPLVVEQRFEGSLVVEFDVRALVDDGFHNRIRSEFGFEVFDAETSIYQYKPEGPSATHPHRELGAVWPFAMRNRQWRFEVVPRSHVVSKATGLGSAPVLALGLMLSAGLAALVNLLLQRVNLYRVAHRQAVKEIVERRRAEEALRVSEERYRSVFSSATDGLLLIDDDDRVVQANPAACRMHGWEPGELDGQPVYSLIAPASRHLYRAFKDRPEASGVFRADAVHRRADGSVIEVEVRASQFRTGTEQRMLAIITDVTERKRAVQQLGTLSRKVLMAQEEERARVSRDLHDELGQLLTASRFELLWLQKGAATLSEELRTALARSIDAMEKSAEELRRICRGLRPPLLDDLGLEPAIQLLTRDFQDRTSHKIDFESQVDESAHVSKEVALCTYRVLQESFNNISRHANANNVDVTLVVRRDELKLSVYDDGQGFEAEALPMDGGVGIAGMRERASLVGGVVELRSTPMQGTRVVLHVPLAATDREEAS